MSSENHEFNIELIEYAIDILSGRRLWFSVGHVLSLAGLNRSSENVSLVCWVAEQCGCDVKKVSGEWEIVP